MYEGGAPPSLLVAAVAAGLAALVVTIAGVIIAAGALTARLLIAAVAAAMAAIAVHIAKINTAATGGERTDSTEHTTAACKTCHIVFLPEKVGITPSSFYALRGGMVQIS